jgi:hypothetical protein
LTQKTEAKPAKRYENQFSRKFIIAIRINAAIEKLNKKTEENPKMFHYRAKGLDN